MSIVSYTPIKLGRRLVWSGYALILLVAPWMFASGSALSVLTQMGTMMIFALSYNMLLGQGGMLSFGHAVYSGLGAFFAAHAMNLQAWWLPVPLIPVVGALAGLVFGVLFGYVTTKKSGTTFSMITLGVVELVFACSLMFPRFFGGEGGIATNRVYGASWLGINFGAQIQVYYLIAAWLFITTIAMFAFTRTPLGRMINAVRDNPERAEFVGYDPQWLRYLALIASSVFAGIAGALTAINFEIVTAENLSAARSGTVLLFVFIGGAGFFFGPLLGAILGVFLTVLLSDFTKAWLLYLGVFFILIVMYAPGGVASLLMLQLRLHKFQRLRRVWRSLWPVVLAAGILLAGAILGIEMLYVLSLETAQASQYPILNWTLDVRLASAWAWVVGLLGLGALVWRLTQPRFAVVWDEVQQEIETQTQQGQA